MNDLRTAMDRLIDSLPAEARAQIRANDARRHQARAEIRKHLAHALGEIADALRSPLPHEDINSAIGSLETALELAATLEAEYERV